MKESFLSVVVLGDSGVAKVSNNFPAVVTNCNMCVRIKLGNEVENQLVL